MSPSPLRSGEKVAEGRMRGLTHRKIETAFAVAAFAGKLNGPSDSSHLIFPPPFNPSGAASCVDRC